jgi:hypothetical protein
MKEACVADNGWCTSTCTGLVGICPKTTAPPGTPVVVDDVYVNCAQPVSGFRVLWTVSGIKISDTVRFRVESSTTGWVGVGFHNGLCVPDAGDSCMADTDFVVVSMKPGPCVCAVVCYFSTINPDITVRTIDRAIGNMNPSIESYQVGCFHPPPLVSCYVLLSMFDVCARARSSHLRAQRASMTGNGMPAESSHGVVSGTIGRMIARIPPNALANYTEMSFSRTVHVSHITCSLFLFLFWRLRQRLTVANAKRNRRR